jgi:hypothetical protein
MCCVKCRRKRRRRTARTEKHPTSVLFDHILFFLEREREELACLKNFPRRLDLTFRRTENNTLCPPPFGARGAL